MGGSRRIHKIMVLNVMRSPMAFFDVTPSGWILNRFSKDMDISKLYNMLFYPAIGSKYFAKTQTYVALFVITVIGEHKCQVLEYDEILRET